MNPKSDAQTECNLRARERFLESVASGVLKHAIPAQFGGHANGFEDLVAAHRRLGRESLDSGLLLSLNAHLWGWVFPLLSFGSEEQKSRWLKKSLHGQLIGGHAITEPGAGSDLTGLRSEAVLKGKEWILNGHKRWISNALFADYLMVYAWFERKLCAFIVAQDDPGVSVHVAALRATKNFPPGEVTLCDCRIPRERLLGKIGAGNLLIQHALELERAFVFAGISGILEYQLERVIAHSRERIVGSAHLGKNQAISHKIAEMKLRLDTLNLWLAECARLKDSNRRIGLAAAQTKLFGAEAFLQSSLDTVQILGARGLAADSPWPALVQDAMASRLYSGTSEIQKNLIAALLGTGEGYRRPVKP